MIGGKVVRIANFAGMERGGEGNQGPGVRRREQDVHPLQLRDQGAGRRLRLQRQPVGQAIGIELLFDGYDHPEFVSIGADGVPAPPGKFTLPANPGQNADENEPDEK